MNIISEMITQRLSGPLASQLSQRLGVSESTAQTAVQLAVPVILAALARNASKLKAHRNSITRFPVITMAACSTTCRHT